RSSIGKRGLNLRFFKAGNFRSFRDLGSLILGFLLIPASALAVDWPQFRGPGGSSVSDETGLPVRWSQTENIRWKIDLPGRGVSCPVIAEGKVYVTACSGFQQN